VNSGGILDPFDLLRASLLDLLYELRETGIQLLLVGGYGVYLKQQQIQESGVRTLISVMPQARSTNDLDLFLQTELLVDTPRLRAFAEALDRLGYQVVSGRERYQFWKEIPVQGQTREVKIDLLTREPIGPERAHLEVRRIQVKPKASVGVHAYRTEEAVAVEDEPVELEIQGHRTTGELYRASLFLPQPFSFLMLKLIAFRDQKDRDNPKQDYGRHHALDLYMLVAMTTEPEYQGALRLSQKYRDTPQFAAAATVVQDYFSDVEALGLLRLQEHPQFRPDMELRTFIGVLAEFFPQP
jgi:hypothetical protein